VVELLSKKLSFRGSTLQRHFFRLPFVSMFLLSFLFQVLLTQLYLKRSDSNVTTLLAEWYGTSMVGCSPRFEPPLPLAVPLFFLTGHEIV